MSVLLRVYVHGSHMVTRFVAMCVGPLLWCRTCSKIASRRVGEALRPSLNSFIHSFVPEAQIWCSAAVLASAQSSPNDDLTDDPMDLVVA